MLVTVGFIILYLVHEKSADNSPVIIPYKVGNLIFTTLYGIITVFACQVFASEISFVL